MREVSKWTDELGHVRLVHTWSVETGSIWEVHHVPAGFVIARLRLESDARRLVTDLLCKIAPKLRRAAWHESRHIAEQGIRDVVTDSLLGAGGEFEVEGRWRRVRHGKV